MRYLLLIIFTTYNLNILSFDEKIKFNDFGIVSIGNNKNYIGKHTWKIDFSIKDSLYSLKIKSKSNDRYIYFNLSKFLKIKELEYLEKEETNFFIYKNLSKVFEKKTKINFTLKNNFFIQTTQKPKNKNIRGEIKDFYKVITENNKYSLVRTVKNKKFIYWYLIKNEQIINLHSELKQEKEFNYGKIIISNIFSENTPEFTFIYKTNDNIKFITLGETLKITTSKKELEDNNGYNNHPVYNGFLHYNLKKNG